LYVGQLIERKGLIPFLAALVRWTKLHPSRRVSLTFAGNGPLRSELESHPATDNLRLFFLGDVNYDALPSVYADADFFVFPTLADTWGVVVNEALASGLPVLGSLYGQAVSELVRDGSNGWTFRPDHTSEMAQALERALTASDDQLDSMRNSARETALRLTPEYAADRIERGVLACANGNAGGSS